MLIKYPAGLSLTAYSYCFATLFMVLTGVFTTSGLHEWALTTTEVIAVIYAVSIQYSFNIWLPLYDLYDNAESLRFRNISGYLTTFVACYTSRELLHLV